MLFGWKWRYRESDTQRYTDWAPIYLDSFDFPDTFGKHLLYSQGSKPFWYVNISIGGRGPGISVNCLNVDHRHNNVSDSI